MSEKQTRFNIYSTDTSKLLKERFGDELKEAHQNAVVEARESVETENTFDGEEDYNVRVEVKAGELFHAKNLGVVDTYNQALYGEEKAMVSAIEDADRMRANAEAASKSLLVRALAKVGLGYTGPVGNFSHIRARASNLGEVTRASKDLNADHVDLLQELALKEAEADGVIINRGINS